MGTYLEKLIPSLTKAVVQEEIPAAERKPAGKGRSAAPSRARSNGGRSRTSSTTRSRARGSSRAKAKTA